MINIKTTIDIPRGVVDESVGPSTDAIFVVKKPSQFQNGLMVTGSVNFQSGSSPSLIVNTTTSVTGSFINNFIILADAISQSIVVTLPNSTNQNGISLFVKKIDASANTVTIVPSGSTRIDGATNQIITSQYTSIQVVSYGSNWYII